MKKTSSTPLIIFLVAMMSTSCTKKISAPETTSPATTENLISNIQWEKTETGGAATFTLAANAKEVYLFYEDQQVKLIDKHPVKYMSCYWLYLFFGTVGVIYYTPVSGEVLPIVDLKNIQILVR